MASMVDITPALADEKQRISGYGAEGFVINGKTYPHSVLVLPEKTIAWEVASHDDISLDTFRPIIDMPDRPEMLLIGTGRQQHIIPGSVLRLLRDAGIIAECMDSGSACQTFNILMAEERRIAAALLLPIYSVSV